MQPALSDILFYVYLAIGSVFGVRYAIREPEAEPLWERIAIGIIATIFWFPCVVYLVGSGLCYRFAYGRTRTHTSRTK